MRREKAKFSLATFGITFSASLAVGGVIVAHISPVLLELIKNIIILIFISLLASVVLGYRRFIWNVLSKVWIAAARRIARRYVVNQMREYSSQIRIIGLNNNFGTVNLILEASSSDGIYPEAMLDVVTDPGGEIYGEVQIIQISNSGITVSPTNRINTEFWEKLEDRMKSDPSPPPNIVAKRQIPDGIMDFLKTLL